MKRTLTILGISLLTLCSFTAGVFKVEADGQFWQSLYNDIDNSNIPHDRVKIYLKVISEQVNKQAQDTTKRQ